MTSLWTLGVVLAVAAAAQSNVAGVAAPEWGDFTASAILGWYAWHTAARTIPGLVRHFREELAALRSEHRQERREFHESLAAVRAGLHELAERLPVGCIERAIRKP
jgi:hypothetical protein